MRLISQNTIGFALSVAAAYLCVFYLPYRSILYIFISLGQAHFLISYLYTHKAGKINNGYLLKFTASLFLVGFFSFYVFNHTDFFPILIFITLLLFSSHYFNDEFKIGEIGVVSGRLFSQVAVLLAFVALLLSKIFLLQGNTIKVLAFSALLFTAAFLFKQYKEGGEIYKKPTLLLFFLLNIIVPMYIIFNKNISIYQIAGFIVLFHYGRWYLHYFFKLKAKAKVFYLDAVIWCNLLTIVTFLEYNLSPTSGILYIFFNPIFFYGWTILHIFMSVRKEDYSFKI